MNLPALNIFGDETEFDHVGIAVESIDEVLQGGDKISDSIQDVSVSFTSVHGLTVELIEPTSMNSTIVNMMKKGCKILHICYRVPDLGIAIQNARRNGVHLIAQPVSARAFGNRRIAWL